MPDVESRSLGEFRAFLGTADLLPNLPIVRVSITPDAIEVLYAKHERGWDTITAVQRVKWS